MDLHLSLRKAQDTNSISTHGNPVTKAQYARHEFYQHALPTYKCNRLCALAINAPEHLGSPGLAGWACEFQSWSRRSSCSQEFSPCWRTVHQHCVFRRKRNRLDQVRPNLSRLSCKLHGNLGKRNEAWIMNRNSEATTMLKQIGVSEHCRKRSGTLR